ncbi:hypothetical protein B0H19DRAFT_1058653 [Mycena capillaripes]|nr:hypothetical protein B0H19DRAFT_1058653 [Mycena capillaripes]
MFGWAGFYLSQEASAVLWALQTSTDPGVVDIAELVPELQWPVNLDIRPAQKRLGVMFGSCIDGLWNVRGGMMNRTTACIRAFWLLEMVTEDQRAPRLWTYEWSLFENAPDDLNSIQFWTHIPWELEYTPEITPWALRFIATQNSPENMLNLIVTHFNPSDSALEDASIFPNFLFCLSSCFSCTIAQDPAVLNKRTHYTSIQEPSGVSEGQNPLDYKVADNIRELVPKRHAAF